MMENSSGIDYVVAECVKNALINDLKKVSDNFERANLIRESGFVLVHENAKKEELASLILEDILESYGKVVTTTGEGSVNNYTDRVAQLLKKSRRVIDVAKWKPVISNGDVKREDVLNKCAGKYEDCRHREVTDGALNAFRRSLENKAQKRKLDDVNSAIEEEVNFADMSIFEKEPFPEIGPEVSAKIANQPKNCFNDKQIAKQKTVDVKTSECNFIPQKYATGEGSSKKSNNDQSNINLAHIKVDLVKANSTAPYTKPTAPYIAPTAKLHGTENVIKNNIYIPPKQQNDAKSNTVPDEPSRNISNSFRTARDELAIQNLRKYGNRGNAGPTPLDEPQNSGNTVKQLPHGSRAQPQQQPLFSYGALKKSLGARRTVLSKFVPPIRNEQEEEPVITDDRLKHIDPKMIELISSEIMTKFKPVSWNDIAGLKYAKATIQEAVVWPMLRPDIFTGLRRPPRGILLFGPPGTGKTLIGKCIASQSKSTFFSISASSLTSKWIGDGEKMVRALFAVAAAHQPSVIFIDEVDSLLCQRSETEHESSRRIKTEFLVQLDGAMTSEEERILIVGATNRPQELDEAARRRFTRRLYIPLPEQEARLQILKNLLQSVKHSLTDIDIESIGKLTRGYSGADMESLCREASMEPIRSIPPSQILYFNENEVRPINFEDFKQALSRIRASVSQNDLQHYVQWNDVYGSGISY